jgi:hypothetical protein
VRRVIRFDLDEVRPSEEDILARIGVPNGAAISPALRALINEAAERITGTVEPRGVLQQIAKDEFAAVYRGEGRNAAESPLNLIAPRAAALALFVGTIGERISNEIAALLRNDDPALAMVLDAYASETTNRVAGALAGQFLDDLPDVSDAARVLPYSPGYCGWSLTGQRALFAIIRPDDIGVALHASCLMTPIKSVSGVLVAGDASVHRFRPGWAFCDECLTRDCGPRMVSVRS